MSRYTVDSSRFGGLETLFDDAVTLIVVLTGFLPWLLDLLPGWENHFTLTGLLFFGALSLPARHRFSVSPFIFTALSSSKKIRFQHHHAPPLDHRFSQRARLHRDAALMALLLGAVPRSHRAGPPEPGGCGLAGLFFFQLLLLWLYPVVIAPLFNRYEPLRTTA